MHCQPLSRNVTSKTQVRRSSGSSKETHSCASRGTLAIRANLLVGRRRSPHPYTWCMTTATAVLTLADDALELVRAARDAEPDADALCLVVEVRGVTTRGYDYDLYFQPTDELPEGAALDASQGITVAVPAPSV